VTAALQAALPAANSSASLLATAAQLALVVGAVALVVLTAAVVPFVLEMKRMSEELRATVRRGAGPVAERGRAISENVEFITDALRSDIRYLNTSLRAVGDRLQQASDHMEERLDEFNALLELMQDEAEDLFIDTASTVRGVRAGTRVMTGSEGRRAVTGSRTSDPSAGSGE